MAPSSPLSHQETTARKAYTREHLDVFNILQHPVWVFDIQHKSMWWANGAAVQLWNAASLDELLARDFASDMSSATESRLQDQLDQMQNGRLYKEQWTFYPGGRKGITLKCTCSVVYLEMERPAMLVEAELPDNREFDDSLTRGIELLRHVPTPVSEFNNDGTKCLYRNPEDLRVFGTGATTFVERFVDAELGKKTLTQVQEGQECSVEAELYVSADRGTRWFLFSIRRTKDPVNGNFVLVGSSRDITEIIQARADTNRAKHKSEFLAVVAHELRTPLHQVVGYTDMLELTSLSDFQLESVKLIQRSTESLMAIINDLLDMNRIESGKVEVAKMHFPFESVLNACIATAEKDATLKGLVIKRNYANNIPHKVIGDANKMRQIVLNLLSNSVKFTKEGSISLNVYPVAEHTGSCTMRLEVVDTGIGISKEDQELVFEQYRQVNMAATREHDGTGLGLFLCKNLATIMGGTIGLQSDPGRGSTFCVELPFEVPPEEDIHVQAQAHRLIPLNGPLRVLVVEDNKVNAKMAQRMLQKIGHTVLMAENGQVSLDVLEQEAVDLVLMDIQMPVMDGIEATRQIRMRLKHSKQSLPVVGLTASFQHSDMKKYMDVGMNTCLSKPIRLEALKRALDAVSSRCAHGLYNQ